VRRVDLEVTELGSGRGGLKGSRAVVVVVAAANAEAAPRAMIDKNLTSMIDV
jgi:hypothetical protein